MSYYINLDSVILSDGDNIIFVKLITSEIRGKADNNSEEKRSAIHRVLYSSAIHAFGGIVTQSCVL